MFIASPGEVSNISIPNVGKYMEGPMSGSGKSWVDLVRGLGFAEEMLIAVNWVN